MPATEIVELEQGWAVMQEGIDKLTGYFEESEDTNFTESSRRLFTADEYMEMYTAVYNMCTQRAPHEYSEQLYERYKDAFVTYLRGQVLPRLNRQDSGPHLLSALAQASENQQTMVRWLSRFFNYLDRYYVSRHHLPSLEQVALLAFKDEVYAHVRERTKEALLDLIGREREQEQIGRGPVRAAIQMFVNVSTTDLDNYKGDFECALLASVSAHYRRKAAVWIESDSCVEYLINVEASLREEDERAVAYLHAESRPKIIAATQQELLLDEQSPLIENDPSCRVMLREIQPVDLSRFFFQECAVSISRASKPVKAEGMAFASQVSAVAGVGLACIVLAYVVRWLLRRCSSQSQLRRARDTCSPDTTSNIGKCSSSDGDLVELKQ